MKNIHSIEDNAEISVVIAVYNSEQFIRKAIESVLSQVNILEVIVVNDGSQDGTEAILNELVLENPRIKVLQHKNGINRGRAASRNLGIKHAQGKFIAFLDSDDFYLENRFENDLRILNENPNIDGVYNALGVHFYRDYTPEEYERLKLTSVKKRDILPEDLFKHISPIGNDGYFSGDALIVRKEVFSKVGLFNEKLKVCEDTELWLRITAMCRLAPGIIDKPVVMRGVHEENVFTNQNLYYTYRLLAYSEFFDWINSNLKDDQLKIGLSWKLVYTCFIQTNIKHNLLKRIYKELEFTLKKVIKYPSILTNHTFLRNNFLAKIYLKIKGS